MIQGDARLGRAGDGERLLEPGDGVGGCNWGVGNCTRGLVKLYEDRDGEGDVDEVGVNAPGEGDGARKDGDRGERFTGDKGLG